MLEPADRYKRANVECPTPLLRSRVDIPIPQKEPLPQPGYVTRRETDTSSIQYLLGQDSPNYGNVMWPRYEEELQRELAEEPHLVKAQAPDPEPVSVKEN